MAAASMTIVPPAERRRRHDPERRRLLALFAAAVLVPSGAVRASAPATLFAAASTTEAITAIAAAFATSGRGVLRPVFAASSTLAQQIARGAPADLFLSANGAWMDILQARGVIDAASRIDLLGNRLVLIAPADSPLTLTIAAGFPLAEALSGGRLVLGDPAHVPAGAYAKAALQSLGVWERIEPKAAYAADVRVGLALVERHEAAAGIVYATDAAASRRVRVVGVFPADSHPAIRYPLAIVAGRHEMAAAPYEFLRGVEAQAIFAAHGFTPVGSGA